MRRIDPYIAGKTRPSAADLNAIAGEAARLGRIWLTERLAGRHGDAAITLRVGRIGFLANLRRMRAGADAARSHVVEIDT